MPRLLPEAPALSPRALPWVAAAAGGAAFAAFAGLIGRWSASPVLGWALAAAAAALGAVGAALMPATDEEGARAWTAAGALAALAVPALLRTIGLSFARPDFINVPMGDLQETIFVLGQAGLLAAFTAGAWTRAARSGGAPMVAPALALAGAAAAALGVRAAEPAAELAAAGLAALAAAVILERPWARRRTAPLRARAFATAAAAGLALAPLAPRLLRDVWMARLHAVSPGGRYLTFADDGVHVWAAYRFANGAGTMLRDGVAQAPDPATVGLALRALLAQHGGGDSLLLVRPPDPRIALVAQEDGAAAAIGDGTPAEAAALDALGGGPEWRRALKPPTAAKPSAALVFLPSPAGAERERLAGRGALAALRGRLGGGAAAAVLLPPGAAAGDADAVARAAAGAFGRARVADLPKGVLVLASAADVMTDPALDWRPAPSEK